MSIEAAQNEKKILWTKHVKKKMRQYRFSEKRILRVLRRPDRKEAGIAPATVAAMQIVGSKKHPSEIWLMYQLISTKQKSKEIKIISAWRYPGRSPLRQPPPIPDDVLDDLDDIIKN